MRDGSDLRFLDRAMKEIAATADRLVHASQSPDEALAVAIALTSTSVRIYESLGGKRFAARILREVAEIEEGVDL